MNEEHTAPTLREFLVSPAFSYEVRRSAAAFGILVALSFGGGLALPEVRDLVAEWMFSAAEQVAGEEGRISMWALLSNNLTACGLSILYGLLPFLYYPALALGLNAVILGGLGAYYVANGYPLGLYLAGLLPHGVFELPALILSFSGGLYLCGQLTRRLRKRETAMPLLQSGACLSMVYMVLIAPLLLAAAYLEAYVTPLIVSLFLGNL